MDLTTIKDLIKKEVVWHKFDDKKFYHPDDIYLGLTLSDSRPTDLLPERIVVIKNIISEKISIPVIEKLQGVFDYDGRELQKVEVFLFKGKHRQDDTDLFLYVPASNDKWTYKKDEFSEGVLFALNDMTEAADYFGYSGVM